MTLKKQLLKVINIIASEFPEDALSLLNNFDDDLNEFHHFLWDWNLYKRSILSNSLFTKRFIQIVDSDNYDNHLFYIELIEINKIKDIINMIIKKENDLANFDHFQHFNRHRIKIEDLEFEHFFITLIKGIKNEATK